jgi:uncharacterized protein (TIGR02996 family)
MANRVFPSEEIGILEEIRTAPRSDTPRLIYADWLEDHEQGVLADFVRWQIAGKGLVKVNVSKEGSRLAWIDRDKPKWCRDEADEGVPAPEAGLVEDAVASADAWLRPFPEEGYFQPPEVQFHRGLPITSWSRAHISNADDLDAIAGKLPDHLRLEGLVVRVDRLGSAVGRVLAHPALRRATAITIPMLDDHAGARDFLRRFAESDLPEHVFWLLFLPLAGRTAGTTRHDIDLCMWARDMLDSRMYVRW